MNKFDKLLKENLPEVYEKNKSKEWKLSKEILNLQLKSGLSTEDISKYLKISTTDYLKYLHADSEDEMDYEDVINELKQLL